MASESTKVLIVRVKPVVKQAARRKAKASKLNLTEYITRLILADAVPDAADGQ